MEPSKEKYTPVYCDNTHNSVFRAGPVKGRASGGEGPAKTHCPQRLWAEQIMPDLIENNTEVLAFQEGMDELLSRLDEFCTILDTFRSQSSELLWHQVPLVLAKAAAMRSVYSRIDKFEAFVQMVKDCVCSLELQVLEVERTQKGFPCSLHGILRPFQRSPSDSQGAPAKEQLQLKWPHPPPLLLGCLALLLHTALQMRAYSPTSLLSASNGRSLPYTLHSLSLSFTKRRNAASL